MTIALLTRENNKSGFDCLTINYKPLPYITMLPNILHCISNVFRWMKINRFDFYLLPSQ